MAEREFGGQPWWVWAVGAAAVGGGYLWIRHSQGTAAAQQTAAGSAQPAYIGAAPTGLSTDQLAAFLGDWQSQPATTPAPKPKPKRKPKRKPKPKVNPGGPARHGK